VASLEISFGKRANSTVWTDPKTFCMSQRALAHIKRVENVRRKNQCGGNM